MTKEELEKENAELDCQKNRNKACYSCANATERCFKNEIGCPCEKYKSYKGENAELKEKISVLLSCKNCSENKGGWICVKEYENKCLSQKIEYIHELKKENAELKGIKDIATLIRANNDIVITLMQLNNMLVNKNQQFTKAKEIIKKFLEFVNNEVSFDPEHQQEYTDLWNELCEKAEKFISEVEKWQIKSGF